MPDSQPIQIRATAATLPDALTEALRQITARIKPHDDRHPLTGTIQAEAASIAELLPRLTDELSGLTDDFEATPNDISIDGVRWLEDAIRVWGTVTLSPGAAGPLEIAWVEPPMLEQSEDGWRIEGRARITRPE